MPCKVACMDDAKRTQEDEEEEMMSFAQRMARNNQGSVSNSQKKTPRNTLKLLQIGQKKLQKPYLHLTDLTAALNRSN